MWRIIDTMQEFIDRQTGVRSIMCEIAADTAADLPTNSADRVFILGTFATTIDTGDIYKINSAGAWILQPTAEPFPDSYSKTEINNMFRIVYQYIMYYHVEQISTIGTITFYTFAGTVKNLSIYGNTQQNGTPTPNIPIVPNFCGVFDNTNWTIPITNAGQTVSVNLGQTPTIRKIKKMVLNGSEAYTYQSEYSRFIFTISDAFANGVRNTQCVCTHYQSIHNGEPILDVPDKSIYINYQTAGTQFCIKDETITSLSDFTNYLATQYANGTPVTIWYIISVPETSNVNEPLCIIGDYADVLICDNAGVVIPTINGENILTVDTDLPPSKIVISGE